MSGSDRLSVQSAENLRAFGRATIETASSHWSVSDVQGMTMELGRLRELIEKHSSLQHVQIVETQGYKQKRNGILHRFLILELQRQDKPSVWLRLDRRMHPNTSRIAFILASGESPANDSVRQVSGNPLFIAK